MEKMVSLGKMAATVAHELNNPLSGILTYSKLISRKLTEGGTESAEVEELDRYLDLIQRESQRCGKIVRNLMMFSRQSKPELGSHHLNHVLERALMVVRHHLEISDIQLEHRPLEGDDLATCDANQLEQAFIALLVNAVEAMPEGGTLSVSLAEQVENLEVVIGDTGPGIPEELLPRIFEPFFSTKTSDGGAGVGLGLAVVYGIVERHGGTITVDSDPGGGTRFVMIIPRKPAESNTVTPSQQEE
jgi:two-component system NtrC family sensor kinase